MKRLILMLLVYSGGGWTNPLNEYMQAQSVNPLMDAPQSEFKFHNIEPEFTGHVTYPKENSNLETCGENKEVVSAASVMAEVTNYTMLCVFVNKNSMLKKKTVDSEEEYAGCLEKGYGRTDISSRPGKYASSQEKECVEKQRKELGKVLAKEELNSILMNLNEQTHINLKSYSDYSLRSRLNPSYGFRLDDGLVLMPAYLNKRCSVVTSEQIAKRLKDYHQRIQPMANVIEELQEGIQGPNIDISRSNCGHLVQQNEKSEPLKSMSSKVPKTATSTEHN